MSNWEDRDYSWLENEDTGDAASDSDEDIESLSQYEYSQRLFDLLVELKLSQRLSAKTVCTIAFWAKGAGVGEPASLLALSPKRTGGGPSEHFDRVTGVKDELKAGFYKLKAPTIF